MRSDADLPDAAVVVVGGGPTGLTVATLLGHLGVPTLVLDRFTGVYPLPRAVHLDDEVARILQRAGVAESFGRISSPGLGLRLLDARHRVLAEFRRDAARGPYGHPQANMFDQPALDRLLRDRAERSPLVTVVGGAEVTAVDPAGDGARVTWHDTASDRTRSVHGRYVLGCDGANSTVRRVMGARLTELGLRQRWLVIDARADRAMDVWHGVHQVCDPARAVTFMPVGDRRYRWEFRLADGESAQAYAEPGTLRELLAPWLRGGTRLSILRRAEYTFRASVADRWRDGRLFLLGDAAHLTPPFIGQGLGAGLRDGANLAWKLAEVLRHGAHDRLLDTYQAERRPHAETQIRLAVTAGRAMTGGRRPVAVAQRLTLRVAGRTPGAQRLVLGRTSPRLRPGPLVRRRRLRDRAGQMCPQPWIVHEGHRRRLDDVLGDGFAVLSGRPVTGEERPVVSALRARVIRLSAREPTHRPLLGWLRGGALVIRPDRTVAGEVRALRATVAAWWP